MTTHQFNHMGLTVSDVDQSVEFYADILGLPRPPEGHDFEIKGAWLSNLVAADDAVIRVAFLPLDHGVLELLEYQHPEGKPTATLRNWDVGSAHLALNHPDVRGFYAANRERLPFNCEPQVVEGGPWAGTIVVYLTDPDGVSVELVQSV